MAIMKPERCCEGTVARAISIMKPERCCEGTVATAIMMPERCW